MPRTSADACSRCGKSVQRGSDSAAEIVCLECRQKWCPRGHLKVEKKPCLECLRGYAQKKRSAGYVPPSRRRECVDCGGPVNSAKSETPRCNPCYRKHESERWAAERDGARSRRRAINARRKARDDAAPGVWNEWARVNTLLPRWKRQGRVCAYCGVEPVAEVDHVVPLALGGTNHIGNLVPACRRCNGSKSNQMLSVWRYRFGGPSFAQMTRAERVRMRATFERKCEMVPRLPVVHEMVCELCGSTFTTLAPSAKYCGDQCKAEKGARAVRDRYRAANGLIVDPSEPTKMWMRRKVVV